MVFSIEEAEIKDFKEASILLRHIAFKLKYVKEKFKKHFSSQKLIETLYDYLIDEGCGFYLCKKEGKIVGLLMCYLYQPFIADKNFHRCQDLLIQPDPDLGLKEKSKIFLTLLDAYEKWAKEKKVKEMFIGVNVRNDISKSLERKGFELADLILKKEV